MWYASPSAPCWTAMARLPALFFLNASASFSSCANVFGTLASFVLTTRPTFSSAYGHAVELLHGGAVRERVERVRRELRLASPRSGTSGSTRPLAASCAGPVVRADDDVGCRRGRRRSRGRRGCCRTPSATTLTLTPRVVRPGVRDLVTAALRSLSVQIVIVGGLRCRAARCAANAAATTRERRPTSSAACASLLHCLPPVASIPPRVGERTGTALKQRSLHDHVTRVRRTYAPRP